MPANHQTHRGRTPALGSGARAPKIVAPPPAAFTTPYAAEIRRVEDELEELQSACATTKGLDHDHSIRETDDSERALRESPVSLPSSPPLLPPLSPIGSIRSLAGRERSLSPVPSLSWSQGPSIPGTSSEFGDDEEGERGVESGNVERSGSGSGESLEESDLDLQLQARQRSQTVRSSCSVRIVGGEVAGVRLSDDGDVDETASIHEPDGKKMIENWPLPSGSPQQRPKPQTQEKEFRIWNDCLPRPPPRAATAEASPELKAASANPAKLRKERPLSGLPRSSTDPSLADSRPQQLKRHTFHASSAPAISFDDLVPMTTSTATDERAPASGSKSSSPTRQSPTTTQQHRQSKTKFPSLNNILSINGGFSAPISLGLVSTTPKSSPTKESLPESSPLSFSENNRAASTAFTGDQKRSSASQISPRGSATTLAQTPTASIAQAKKDTEVAESVRLSNSQSHNSAGEQRPAHHRRASSKLQAAASFLFGFGGGNSGSATGSPPRSPIASSSSPTRSGATSPLKSVQHQRAASSAATSVSAGDVNGFKAVEYDDESDLGDDDGQVEEDDEILNMDISAELAGLDGSNIEDSRAHAENLLRGMQTMHAAKLRCQRRQYQHLCQRHKNLRVSKRQELDRLWRTLQFERQDMEAQKKSMEQQTQREIEESRSQQLQNTQDLREGLADAKEREHHLKRQLDGMAGRTEKLEKEVRTGEAEIERLKWCLGEVKGELTDRKDGREGVKTGEDGRASPCPENYDRGEREEAEDMKKLKRLHRESKPPFVRSEVGLEDENAELKRRIRELEETVNGCLGLVD